MAYSAQVVAFSAGSSDAGFHGANSQGERQQVRGHRPVDLVHLSRQSLGDRELELEILGLFVSQSKLYIDRLGNAKTADERKMAAHTILGSARGIGAWVVAEEAEVVELNASGKSDLAPLRHALDEANAFIENILSDC